MNNDVQQENPKKLFVGNISWNVTEPELQDLFGQYGEVVSVKLVIDRMTGRSRGIAFVEYTSEEDAAAAVEALNNYELDGRALNVNVARPQAPREQRSFNPRFGGGGSGGGNDRRGGGGGSRDSFGRGGSRH